MHPQDSFTPPQSRNSLSSATPNPSSLSSSSRSSSPFLHSHSDSTRDSGIISTESADEDVPFVLMERRRDIAFEKLLQKIIAIVEDTLSNEKLTKDLYVLRQMRRNSQGYVSLKLVASVKAIKKLTSDYDTVVLALRKSNKLEVNKSATKVRRKDALPAKSVATSKEPSSLVVVGLPEVEATIESVISKYKEFGTIAQVRILSPKRPIPAYLQGYVAALPYLGQMWCAIVEYEKPSCTMAAYRELSKRIDELPVTIIGPGFKKNVTKKFKMYSL
uniref:HTH La-type RNA-binding domain-containing protein n=2 Tax=Ciona intestinalis TaxID=7719 RepID=H2XRN3_CIOIN